MAVVTRRLEHEKRQLEERLHILEALAKIYDDLDRAIRIIRKAESRADASTQLMAAFKLDEVQATPSSRYASTSSRGSRSRRSSTSAPRS